MESLHEQFRSCAARIANDLLSRAERDPDGLFWSTAAMAGKPRRVLWRPSIDLYSGVSGIALFLNEAAHVLGDSRYSDAAIDALRWCVRQSESVQSYGFYSGRTGVVHALVRSSQLTGDESVLDDALRVASGYESFASNPPCADFLAGAAGAVIGYLRLHAATGEPWTARAAEELLAYLINNACWTPEGVSWDVRRENI